MKFPQAIASLIPPAGDEPHKEFMEEQVCTTTAAAENLFEKAVHQMRQPHRWKDLAGVLSADFQPHTSRGKPFEGPVKEGDLLKIKVGSLLPLGEDWVVISHFVAAQEKEVSAAALQVHPCAPPATGTTEHFFDACATSTWIICRQNTTVRAYYYGRQEVANEESKGLLRTVRDKVVAAAAVMGIADLQWKALLKGMLGT